MRSHNKITLFLFIACMAFSCASKTEQESTNETSTDTVQQEQVVESVTTDPGMTSGEYLVGDGNVYLVRVGDTYEWQDEQGKAMHVFYFQGKEQDTLSVYSNKDKSITFKMNPGQKKGTYYAPGEQWPVEFIEEIPSQEN